MLPYITFVYLHIFRIFPTVVKQKKTKKQKEIRKTIIIIITRTSEKHGKKTVIHTIEHKLYLEITYLCTKIYQIVLAKPRFDGVIQSLSMTLEFR